MAAVRERKDEKEKEEGLDEARERMKEKRKINARQRMTMTRLFTE